MTAYHPSFFDPKGSHRADCEKRLQLIKDNLSGRAFDILDIGCSGGYYSFGMGDGCDVFGIDTEQPLIDECNMLAEQNDAGYAKFECMELSEFLIDDWGNYDICLYMSVHHHMIARHGIQMASYLLKMLSSRCEMMFFDMGQHDEYCPQHKWWNLLPPCQDQKKWLVDYLYENTVYENINIIGSTAIHNIERYFLKCD